MLGAIVSEGDTCFQIPFYAPCDTVKASAKIEDQARLMDVPGCSGMRIGLGGRAPRSDRHRRSEEHTSELQSLMRISYAVFCLKNKIDRKKMIKAHDKNQHTNNEHVSRLS